MSDPTRNHLVINASCDLRPQSQREQQSPIAGVEDLDHQIRNGVLIAGRQLPTARQLATDPGLAKNTVVRAYRRSNVMASSWATGRRTVVPVTTWSSRMSQQTVFR